MAKTFNERKPPVLLVFFVLGVLFGPAVVCLTPTMEGRLPNVTCTIYDSTFNCDCGMISGDMSMAPLWGFVYQLTIQNCRSLIIPGNVLLQTQGLQNIVIMNIDSLELQENSLNVPRFTSHGLATIHFENVRFDTIHSHAIKGNIETISFAHGEIRQMHAFGFATFVENVNVFRMTGVIIRKLDPQAFKKFSIRKMEIVKCYFESSLPSKTFHELEVLDEFLIKDVQFQNVHSHAFSFTKISKLKIVDNSFKSVDAEWITARITQSITIANNNYRDNSVIAFSGLSPHVENLQSGKQVELRFLNNTVHFPSLDPQPLQFNNKLVVNIEQLQYDNIFSCYNTEMIDLRLQPKSAFFREHSDTIYFHYSEGKPEEELPYKPLNAIIETNCTKTFQWIYIVIGITVFTLILLIITISIGVYIIKRRRRLVLQPPEPRTIKHTQIVYRIENAGLLKTDL